MFYIFKITKSGLKYIGDSKIQEFKRNMLYLTKDEISKISPEVISNIKDLKGIV